ncbi:hypothetical protein B9T25_06300 [Acinetobacter sp. ANC 4470]|uniref:hypothetical protein n=1 Tax=Acinetobacter sp. ANC 4470 TaxID=1977881 RepID=UPI000A3485C3|nr:hypothetical protein [Acinetobacter sp. ANC 4470]OTG68289.1 hypothetical protein B9T25_06300 [Acinetobacter sp. ANC 4470]
MSLSKEQKTFAIKELEKGNRVNLTCDSYEISLMIQRHKMKLVVGIYVDGTVKGIWCAEHEKHPEAKYLAPYFINVYKPSFKQKLIKLCGKRRAYKEYPDLDAKHEHRLPYFANVTKAINHLIKVSDSIELLTEMAT